IALLLIALCPIAAFSQKTDSAPATLVRLHYVKPRDIAGLLNGLVVVKANNALKAVVLRGDPQAVAKAKEIIQKLDVPQAKTSERNIVLTMYVIGATNKPAPAAAKMPESLQPVVRQLKAIFPYSSYSLLDSMLLRSREGTDISTTSTLKFFPSQPPSAGEMQSICNISYHLSPQHGAETSNAVRLSEFRFDARIPFVFGSTAAGATTQFQQVRVGFKTTLDLPEGKKAVVGKTDIDKGDAALFVVLSAKVE
ncbi:MAG: secretin N-terminal domain-containing protein, partial [Bryobacteraceae bacterium]